MVNNAVYHFVDSNLVLLKKKEHQKKGALMKRTEAPVHFVLGFQKNFMQSLSAFLVFS